MVNSNENICLCPEYNFLRNLSSSVCKHNNKTRRETKHTQNKYLLKNIIRIINITLLLLCVWKMMQFHVNEKRMGWFVVLSSSLSERTKIAMQTESKPGQITVIFYLDNNFCVFIQDPYWFFVTAG